MLIAAVGAGCGVSKPTGDGGATDPATNPDDGGSRLCRGSIEQAIPFGGCPRQFDDDSWKARGCYSGTVESVCTGYRSRSFNLVTHSWTCYYDPTTLALIAGKFRDDIQSFCDGGNEEITLGTIPAEGVCSSASTPCGSDGGVDHGGVDGHD